MLLAKLFQNCSPAEVKDQTPQEYVTSKFNFDSRTFDETLVRKVMVSVAKADKIARREAKKRNRKAKIPKMSREQIRAAAIDNLCDVVDAAPETVMSIMALASAFHETEGDE
jgi:hypothetical protein